MESTGGDSGEQSLKEWKAEKLKQEGKDSVHNSDEENDQERDARELKQNSQHIKYDRLGSEECPIDIEAEDIEYSMVYRIQKIENLD